MTYQHTLEQYLNSDDFVDGVVAATKAAIRGRGGYSVELFPTGIWRNLRNNQIDNKYETPGVILRLPELAAEATEDLNEEMDPDLYDYDVHQRVVQFRDEIAEELRENMAYWLAHHPEKSVSYRVTEHTSLDERTALNRWTELHKLIAAGAYEERNWFHQEIGVFPEDGVEESIANLERWAERQGLQFVWNDSGASDTGGYWSLNEIEAESKE